jgi:hypothetical protein
MKTNSTWSLRIAIFVAYVLGTILFSQAASFARWDEFHPSKYFVNFHAGLLFLAGVSIIALSGGITFLSKRVSDLDRRVSELAHRENA